MDLIPSELIQRVEVTKSVTPDMEGDAIGGTVNVIMKDAPDTNLLIANLATGYRQLLINTPFQTFDYKAVKMKDPYEASGIPGYAASLSDFTRNNLKH